ncbi:MULTISPECIES: DUF441 family protein [Bacillus]|uniref:DUF441 domain-containing protein n=1 Tax=Bacillus pseudomycoides TaxID=64104 RepID=A0A2C3WQU6_9BACI|nr:MULTISPECIES: DUF441 family protein [Bacillus cereus group]EJQ62651.1 hypothetical protein IG7_05303 [Bacillus cereus HuA2-4]PDY47976.1 DUF441 domain-containing protein [Bacillus pseudomycoides]PEA82693.1 DUF441 domain-containing protein [Bacillus pseudomycoides]PEI32178.1 DUF441 domain-containing protein [Bacillus pseudomycoides]PEJ68075.1 DUF441 domain-containing protein [Bacillus pseudomycoides]
MLPFLLLGIIVTLALLVKDYALAGAACLLGVLLAVGQKTLLHLIQQYSFTIGIFFLMLFLLVPITSGKITSEHVIKLITSPIGLGSILAGFTVSYIGGKGVGVLPMNPTILLGVLIGTLIAVLFTKGLPAGLIIAAGIIAIISMK